MVMAFHFICFVLIFGMTLACDKYSEEFLSRVKKFQTGLNMKNPYTMCESWNAREFQCITNFFNVPLIFYDEAINLPKDATLIDCLENINKTMENLAKFKNVLVLINDHDLLNQMMLLMGNVNAPLETRLFFIHEIAEHDTDVFELYTYKANVYQMKLDNDGNIVQGT